VFIHKRTLKTYDSCLRRGALEISLRPTETGARLMVTLHGAVDPHFYRHAARRFERLLRRTAATLSLQIDEFRGKQLHQLEHLLGRLSLYGDRVSVRLDDKLGSLLTIDPTVFRLIPEEESKLPATAG